MNPNKHAKKAPKPASIYRKPISEKVFRSKYLKLLELPADRALLESSFTLTEGHYSLRQDLAPQDLERLNKLASAIRANRGALKTGPLVAVVLLGGGIAVFGLFFMNPLLERAAERGLEAAFGARAEIASFRLQPLRLRVSMASLAVADRERPMKNLFETGRIEFRLSPASLLRGRIYIEEASAASIAVGTPRKSSGALPGTPEPPTPPARPVAEVPPLVDLAAFDAAGLLEREKSKLAVTALYAEAAAAFEKASAAWKDRVAEGKKRADELKVGATGLLALDPRSLTTPEAVARAVADARRVAETTSAAVGDFDQVAAGVRSDLEAAQALEGKARKAVAEDFARLRTYVDPRSGAALGALEPSIKELLSDRAEVYLYYGRRALAAAEKLSAAKEDKPAVVTRRGRDVRYPSATLPRFRLGLLASTFSVGDRAWSVELREVSSDPDLVPSPTTLKIAVKGGGEALSAEAVADLRSASGGTYSARVQGEGFPVDLGTSLSQAGFGSVTGIAAFTATLDGKADASIQARGSIALTRPAVAAPRGLLATAVADAFASAGAVRMDAAYRRAPPGGEDGFELSTNLDDLVAAAMRATAERYAKKALAELDSALQAYVGKELAGKLVAKEDLKALASFAAGDKTAVSQLSASVEAKRAALEARGTALVEETKRQAEAAARKAAAEAEAAAKKAEAEARKKAEDEAKKAAQKVKPPKIKL